MNWLGNRLLIVAALFALQSAHAPGIDSDADAVLLYHASCQIADLCIIWLLPKLAKSGLAHDLQCINLAAILANFIGYFLYVTYSTPLLYNVIIYTLLAAQYLRLIWPKNDEIGLIAAAWGWFFNRCRAAVRGQDYKAAQA